MPNNLMQAAIGGSDGNAPTASPAVPGRTPPGEQSAPPGAGGSGAQGQVTLDQVKDAIKKQALIDHSLRGLLKSGKPVEKKDAISMGVSLVAQRVLSAEEMAGYFATLPNEPMQVRDWLENHAANVEGNLDKMMAMIAGQEAHPDNPNTPGFGVNG